MSAAPITPVAAQLEGAEWKRRWVTPACQVEVIYHTLERAMREWMAAARISYQHGAGVRSGGRGAATYFCMVEADAAALRQAFAERLAQQRKDFGLRDYQE